MTTVAWILFFLPVALFGYAYVGYPAVLWLLVRVRSRSLPEDDPPEWPELTVLLPVYNEERTIAGTLESLLALDYPPGRRHILVVSDASTDRTDEMVGEFSGRGVRLLRLAKRTGKSGAENAAAGHLQGTVVVNTDATTRILPGSLKALVRVFSDPSIGVSSGRDISVESSASIGLTPSGRYATEGESGYVGYEMWVRSLETRLGSIVGASGCLYAVRRELVDPAFPPALSRDFASALIAAERGYRAVSVPGAACLVPRARSLPVEFRRKVRTMARGLDTLWYKRKLLVPAAQPVMSFALISHKLIRWLGLFFAPLALLGLGLLAPGHDWARWFLGAALAGLALGGLAYLWPEHRKTPRLLALLGFAVGSVAAGFFAWTKALTGEASPIWEPTRRA